MLTADKKPTVMCDKCFGTGDIPTKGSQTILHITVIIVSILIWLCMKFDYLVIWLLNLFY